MRIHAMKTGAMAVKNHYVEADGRLRVARLMSALLDSEFREIPIYTWAIEHPEGVIVIDTGETAHVNDPNFFPTLQRPYWKSQYRFHVSPEDEIGAQLRIRGIDPEDVRWLVLTHAHFDHTDALYHFPNAQVLFSRREYIDVMTWRSAHFGFPSKYPDWLKPVVIDYVPEPFGAFDQGFVLTRAGDVRIVPTPGHTMGHQSVILQDDGLTYFFGGDTSFDLDSLLNAKLDAPAFNSDATFRTRQRILDTATDMPLIYLTTHDFDTPTRLEGRTPLMARAGVPVAV